MEKFILASASPRRRELMSVLGLDFEVVVSDADEAGVDKTIPVNLYVQELAMLKASATAEKLIREKCSDCLIISADTVVCCDGRILGKPKDREDATAMLRQLSGRAHEVYTGICVMRLSDGYTVCDSRMTRVWFLPLTEEKICAYIETGEPMDKAGAYGIQGLGSTLIEKIDGDYFNVVGLPLAALAALLEKEFEVQIV